MLTRLSVWKLRKQSAKQELPEALRARLQQIPHEMFLCRDVDRLWALFLTGEIDAETTGRFQGHLDECERCRILVVALGDARQETTEPPPDLLQRLRQIPLREGSLGARGRLRAAPWWVMDLRFAATACYALALVAVALCGKPSDCLDQVTSWATQRWAKPVASVAQRVGGVLSGDLPGQIENPPAALWNEAVEMLRNRSLSLGSTDTRGTDATTEKE